MIIKNVLSQSAIDTIQEAVNACPDPERQERFGRYMYHNAQWQDRRFMSPVRDLVNEITGKQYRIYGFTVAEYTAAAGVPNLPPHFDGDNTDLIMTYQLQSNKKWGVGVDLNVYELEDNDGVIFHPNESIHWRPHAKFEDGEFVRVMFIRFRLPNKSDYSHLRFSQADPIFNEVQAFKDKLWADEQGL